MHSGMRRCWGLVLGGLVSLSITGCMRENPGFLQLDGDSESGDDDDDELESGDDDDDSSTSGPSLSGGSLGDSGAGSTSSSTSEATTGDDGAATTGDDGTIGESETTGAPDEPEPEHEHLINYTPGASCDHAGWCVDGQNNDQTLMVNIAGAECFTATLPPPFELVEVHYFIDDVLGELGDSFTLSVIEFVDASPGAQLAGVELPGAEWSAVGEHTLTLDEPLVVDAPGFCVRIEGGVDEQSTLGIGLDLDSDVPEVSFVQSAGCGVPALTDWFTLDNAIQTGNWCVDAEIREIL